MSLNQRSLWVSLLTLGLGSVGCDHFSQDQATSADSAVVTVPAAATPPESVAAPDRAEPSKTVPAATPAETPEKSAPPAETLEKPAPAAAAPAETPEKPAPAAAKDTAVLLEPVTYDEFRKRIAANKTKYTIVDAWATWCAPCKENFPHVVEMNKKYADKGLTVVSLSLDQPDDEKQLAEAKKFLEDSGATFTNFLLNEDAGTAFDKLDISGVPAVFVFDATGKEVRRYTGDDTRNQFTYDEVEKDVVALLEGKTLPERGKKAGGEEKSEK